MQEQAPARRHALVVAADARRPSVRAVAPRYHDGFQFRTSGPTIGEGVATPTPGLAPHPTREYVRDRSARVVPPHPALGHDIGQVP